MELSEILSPALCFTKLEGRSQKRIFEIVSEAISAQYPDIDYATIFDALSARERLGSTGLGHGVALPHCRIERLGSGVAAVITLEEPIGFDAPDQKPVDLLVFLLVSGDANQDHLDMLAKVAGILSVQKNRAALRSAASGNELCNLLIGGSLS